MKRYLITTLGISLLAASCSQNQPETYAVPARNTTGVSNDLPKEAAHSRQYLALPGQSARAVSTLDTDAAFEREAAAYINKETPSQPDPLAPSFSDISAFPADGRQQNPDMQPIPSKEAENQPSREQNSPVAFQEASIAAPEPPTIQNPEPKPDRSFVAPPASGASADYALQVTNGTLGRLYVEVQDDSGNVFPISFMYAGQSISTPPMEAKPIVGKLTVVIRDPDQPEAPELRRYKVDPPAGYKGKTVGITILPKGQYRASLDGETYYTSPAPRQPGQD